MLDKIIVVTDLGPGDGGKGSVIHSLASRENASIIIKRGGAQGSHGVRTSQSEKFNFSQWGCGTLEGVPTYCSPQMIISPVGLQNEADALKHHGIYDPFSMLSVDPRCVCATPYHKIESQLSEILLKNHPRGTIGTGVGKAYRMYQRDPDMTIRAFELNDKWSIYHKLNRQVVYYRNMYKDFVFDEYPSDDIEIIKHNLDRLYDDTFHEYITDLFVEIGRKLTIRNMANTLSLYNGTGIVECSHGVLTDSETGFKPHTSAIRTLPKFTNQMLRDAGFDGRILNYGVHRAYEIRHGAGPMPTYEHDFTQTMLPGSHKDENRWQGIVRAGPLDLCLLIHALISSHETPLDGICLTWFDQILSTSRNWRICRDYANPYKGNQLLTDYYRNAIPIVEDHILPDKITKKDLFSFVESIVNEYVDAPLTMLSIGPTEKDKIYKEDIYHG